MGRIPLPSYDELKAAAKDDAALERFVLGMALNPPRQSPWSRWKTRHLRRQLQEMGSRATSDGAQAVAPTKASS